MSQPVNPQEDWPRLMSELRAYHEAERALWGDLDDLVIARYVAGTSTDEERRIVEQAMGTYPAVRELIDVVREVLPQTKPDRAAEPSLAEAIWKRVQQVRTLTDRLMAWVDETGTLLSAGFQRLLLNVEPAYAQQGMPLEETPDRAMWEVPCSEAHRVVIAVWPAEQRWKLAIKLHTVSAGTAPQDARFEIRDDAGNVELAGRLPSDFEEPFYVPGGSWRLIVHLGHEVWEMPMVLGKAV